jgi:hypothetical protein
MKKLFTSIVLISSMSASAFAFAPSIVGKWSIHQNIMGNESDQQCTIAVSDNKISGSCKAGDKEIPIKGTVDGNNVTWSYDTEANGGTVTLTYKATLDKEDKFAGTVDVAPYNVSGDFTATAAK